MPSGKRLSREEKGKAVVDSAAPVEVRAPTNAASERDPTVADSQVRDGAEENAGSSRGGGGNEGLEAQARSYRVPIKRLRKESVEPPEYRPTRYHSGDRFEVLPGIPRETLRDPEIEGQRWRNVFPSYSTHSSVKHLLKSCGAVGVTYLIPSVRQRPWSPPAGYQCVYESYFGVDTKLWFPIPRLITEYVRCRGVAIT